MGNSNLGQTIIFFRDIFRESLISIFGRNFQLNLLQK